MKSTLKNRKAWLLFLLPSVIIFIFTVIFPIIRSAWLGFFDWDGVTPMRFVGLNNYRRLFSDLYFRNALWNNLLYLLINLVGQVGIALFLALLLTKITWGCNFFKTVYFAPTILSSVAVSQAFQKFYATEPPGVFNAVLEKIGLGSLVTPWLGTAQTALTSVALIECYKNMGLYLVILYSRMDGASGIRLFWYIKLPYIRNVMAVAVIMAVNGLLKAFDIPFVTTNGGPGSASELVTTYMYKTAFSSARYGYGSAIAVFIALESILAVLILQAAFHHSDAKE